MRFDRPVTRNGYAWWYLDALSDDTRHGITAIAFIGSVFSPYYAWARRRGLADPLNHCALNVAVYETRGGRWAMTERGASQVNRSSSGLRIGNSGLAWNGGTLELDINEICVPLPRRLRGKIRLSPSNLCRQSFELDAQGLHRWTPLATAAHVEVILDEPAVRWSGAGYLDCNDGDVPLESTFRAWQWSRALLQDRAVVLYDTQPRDTPARKLALEFTRDGSPRRIDSPSTTPLGRTRWGLSRQTRADTGQSARVIRTLEDAPFYSRSIIDTRLLGSRATAIHESLSLDRFRSPWVQCMLPFRMPRSTR